MNNQAIHFFRWDRKARTLWNLPAADRQHAALTTVEAIRSYAAANKGKLPARLEDISETPVPENPATGRALRIRVEERHGHTADSKSQKSSNIHDQNPQLIVGFRFCIGQWPTCARPTAFLPAGSGEGLRKTVIELVSRFELGIRIRRSSVSSVVKRRSIWTTVPFKSGDAKCDRAVQKACRSRS